MKIREGFILREVAGVFAAVPVEGESRQFHGMRQEHFCGEIWKKNVRKSSW